MNEPKRVLKTEELIQKRAMDVKETRELLSLSEKINAALLVNRLRKCKDLSLELRKRVLDNKVNRAVQLRSKYLKSSRQLRSVQSENHVNLILSQENKQKSMPQHRFSERRDHQTREKSNSLVCDPHESIELMRKPVAKTSREQKHIPFLFRAPTKKQIRRFNTVSKLYSQQIEHLEKLTRLEEDLRNSRKRELIEKSRWKLPFAVNKKQYTYISSRLQYLHLEDTDLKECLQN